MNTLLDPLNLIPLKKPDPELYPDPYSLDVMWKLTFLLSRPSRFSSSYFVTFFFVPPIAAYWAISFLYTLPLL